MYVMIWTGANWMPILQGRPDFKKKENSERGDLVAVIYLLYP